MADYLVAEGVLEDSPYEGLRVLLREQGVSFAGNQRPEDQHRPDYEAKKNQADEAQPRRWKAGGSSRDRRG